MCADGTHVFPTAVPRAHNAARTHPPLQALLKHRHGIRQQRQRLVWPAVQVGGQAARRKLAAGL